MVMADNFVMEAVDEEVADIPVVAVAGEPEGYSCSSWDDRGQQQIVSKTTTMTTPITIDMLAQRS